MSRGSFIKTVIVGAVVSAVVGFSMGAFISFADKQKTTDDAQLCRNAGGIPIFDYNYDMVCFNPNALVRY